MTGPFDSVDLDRAAEDAYLFLSPLVLMDVTRRITSNVPAGARPGFGPMNAFTHMRAFPPGDFREVVRPNFDTLYSILWFDLREEPIVVSAPDTGGRYYMLPMLDMWTDVFALVGSRTTGTGEGHYALVGPGWKGTLPDGVTRIDSPTPFGWIIGRTQTNGPADYEAVHAIQDGFVATPLGQWPNPPAPVSAAFDPDVDMTTPPLDQVVEMSPEAFYSYGMELMALHPPHLLDQPILARMKLLGLEVGRAVVLEGMGDRAAAALRTAPTRARERMSAVEPRLSPIVNGWSLPTFGMGVYGTDYLRRAVVAKIGLGANLVEDAIYPVLYADANGSTPDGRTDYVLRFEAGSLPPADAFWSVTMYDDEGFPVPNEIDRYAIGDRDELRFNADGSLDLYLQHDDPGGDRTSNWLPGPRGPLGVTLRIYGPRPEALDGSWAPPPLRPAAVT